MAIQVKSFLKLVSRTVDVADTVFCVDDCLRTGKDLSVHNFAPLGVI